MARKSYLVPVDGDSEPVQILTVTEAADSGDRIAELVAIRRVVAGRIDDPNTPGPALAALVRQQRELTREIHELKGAVEDDDIGHAAKSGDEGFDPASV